MDDVKTDYEAFQKQIEVMEKFIALSFRRESILPRVKSLVKDVQTVRNLVESANQRMEKEVDTLEMEHDKLMRRMREKQTIILDYLLKSKRKNIQKSEEDEVRSAKKQFAVLEVGSLRKAIMCSVTPTMKINDYKESPMVYRPRPNPIRLNFEEFEFEVTVEMFNKVPKYMVGRESLDEINTFLESIIIACFNEKYQLLYRKRSTLRKPKDMELWNLYNQQESYVPGKFFITAGDISRKIGKMIDKKLQNRITILRNIGILKEQRVSQIVCYIWTCNNLM